MPGLDGQTRASRNPDAELRTRTDPPVNTAVQAEDDRLADQQRLLKMQGWHIELFGSITVGNRG